MSRSNAKGGAFERLICKRLSLWISKGKRDDLFWRSAMSGGRATLQMKRLPHKKRYNQCGDLSAISREGQDFLDVFFVDCKFLQSLKIPAWIYGDAGELPKLWDKTLLEAENHRRIPFVVAKQNRKPELIMTTEEGYDWIRKSSIRKEFDWRCRFFRNGAEVYVLSLQEFLVRTRWRVMHAHFVANEMLSTMSRKRVTFDV